MIFYIFFFFFSHLSGLMQFQAKDSQCMSDFVQILEKCGKERKHETYAGV
jgi:hypothetical protein